MFNILVADDNPNTRRLMEAVLKQANFHAIPAEDGASALAAMEKQHVDLALVDVMMPGMDGISFIRELRAAGNDLPVIIVTALEGAQDVKRGFLTGADDYMTKPVNEEELILRIGALLRRSRIVHEHRLTVGDTVLDHSAMTVTRNGEVLELPRKEFLLLFRLLSDAGHIFTRRQLMDEIWNMETSTDERTVDVHINRLRDRFRSSPDFEIVTVRGLGYKGVYRQREHA